MLRQLVYTLMKLWLSAICSCWRLATTFWAWHLNSSNQRQLFDLGNLSLQHAKSAAMKMYLNRGLIFPMQKGDVCCLARCSSYLCEVQETEDSQIIVNCIDKSVWDGNKRASSPVLFSSRTRLLYGIHTCVCNHLCGISVVVELRDKK